MPRLRTNQTPPGWYIPSPGGYTDFTVPERVRDATDAEIEARTTTQEQFDAECMRPQPWPELEDRHDRD